MNSLAVIFPGIGYTCDKPLLYYSAKLLISLGWEVLPLVYRGFPPKVRGDQERMGQSIEIALTQTIELLQSVEWAKYDRILFVSKSIGTVAATSYAYTKNLPCRHILFTPIEAAFACPIHNAIAFHGTSDPWAETSRIQDLCKAQQIPLYTTENANHSLETGDVAKDIQNLMTVMETAKRFLEDMG